MSSWTRIQTEKLIEIFEQYPQLYNVQHVEYQNRGKRESYLREICNALKGVRSKTTPYEVRAKIKTLRSQYLREKKYLENCIKNNSEADEYTPKLWCYKNLQFLSSSANNSPGYFNLSLPTEFVDTADLSDSVENSYSGECSQKRVVIKSSKKRRKLLEKSQKYPYASAGQFSAHQNNTPQRNLANFIEQDLTGIPPHIFHDVKWKIMDLVREAQERALCEERNSPVMFVTSGQSSLSSSPLSGTTTNDMKSAEHELYSLHMRD